MAVWCGAPERPCDGSASSKPGVPEEAKDSKDSVPLSPQSGSRNVKEDKDGPPGVSPLKRNETVWMGLDGLDGLHGLGWFLLGNWKMFFPMNLRVCWNGEIDVKNCI